MIFDCKKDIDLSDLKYMEPALLILFTHSVLYCREYVLPLEVTSIKSDRENVTSKSKTHEEGRAIDISTRGWTEQHIYRFVHLTNKYYKDIAAISSKDLIPRAAVYHNSGYGDHIHLQVRPSAKINKFVKF